MCRSTTSKYAYVYGVHAILVSPLPWSKQNHSHSAFRCSRGEIIADYQLLGPQRVGQPHCNLEQGLLSQSDHRGLFSCSVGPPDLPAIILGTSINGSRVCCWEVSCGFHVARLLARSDPACSNMSKWYEWIAFAFDPVRSIWFDPIRRPRRADPI